MTLGALRGGDTCSMCGAAGASTRVVVARRERELEVEPINRRVTEPNDTTLLIPEFHHLVAIDTAELP